MLRAAATGALGRAFAAHSVNARLPTVATAMKTVLQKRGVLMKDGKVAGRVHSVESFSTIDGVGIRFMIFLQGCPLRWCVCVLPTSRRQRAPRCIATIASVDTEEIWQSHGHVVCDLRSDLLAPSGLGEKPRSESCPAYVPDPQPVLLEPRYMERQRGRSDRHRGRDGGAHQEVREVPQGKSLRFRIFGGSHSSPGHHIIVRALSLYLKH